jgi:serine/threonine protein kinase
VQSTYKIVQGYPMAGTLSYLAPEVMKNILSEKSDIWSSGVLLYILLTGVSPFRGSNESQTKDNINFKALNFSSAPLNCASNEAKDLL